MSYMIETSVLGRLANSKDSLHLLASSAVAELHRRGEELRIAPQNLIEFRNVATRPTVVNGLGLSAAQAEVLAAGYEKTFSLLPETPDIYPAWKSLVASAGIIGKQVHDARLVAVCHVYGITHVLTFNVGHFTRLAAYAPGIIVVDPANV